MDIEVKYLDNSHVQIQAEPNIVYELRDYFSFQPAGYQYQKKYKFGQWNGYIYLMDYNGKLPYGLWHLIKRFADSREYSVWVDPKIAETNDITRESFDQWVEKLDIYSGEKQIKPHWYQSDTVHHAIVNRRGVLNLPTSAGKSLIQCLLSRWFLEQYESKVLIIVPTTTLVDQMINDFVDYRLFPRNAIHGIRGGTAKDSDALIYVSTWQSAVKQPPEWFQQFGCLMVDECHLATGLSITSIINSLTNCVYKFGLSGSLKDGKANTMQYVGAFGHIYKPVDTHQLMKEGQVTNLKINTIFLRYNDADVKKAKGMDYPTEIGLITTHARRNAWIAKLALKLAREKQENIFIMFRLKKHGKWLYDALSKVYDNVVFIDGDTETDVRNEMKKIAENTKGLIIVGSSGVLSTGVSIKNLHHIFFAHPSKSGVTVRQAIGRVLRLHESKSIATLWDIVDNLATESRTKAAKNKYSSLNYCMKHALERISIYNAEKFDYVIKNIDLEPKK